MLILGDLVSVRVGFNVSDAPLVDGFRQGTSYGLAWDDAVVMVVRFAVVTGLRDDGCVNYEFVFARVRFCVLHCEEWFDEAWYSAVRDYYDIFGVDDGFDCTVGSVRVVFLAVVADDVFYFVGVLISPVGRVRNRTYGEDAVDDVGWFVCV